MDGTMSADILKFIPLHKLDGLRGSNRTTRIFALRNKYRKVQ